MGKMGSRLVFISKCPALVLFFFLNINLWFLPNSQRPEVLPLKDIAIGEKEVIGGKRPSSHAQKVCDIDCHISMTNQEPTLFVLLSLSIYFPKAAYLSKIN